MHLGYRIDKKFISSLSCLGLTEFWFSGHIKFSVASLAPALIDHCHGSVHIKRLGSGKKTI